jgi:pilus assembly protein Flp/PilA
MPSRLPSVIRHLVRTQRGASAIEYAVVAALISIAAIAPMGTIGQKIRNALDIVANGFE